MAQWILVKLVTALVAVSIGTMLIILIASYKAMRQRRVRRKDIKVDASELWAALIRPQVRPKPTPPIKGSYHPAAPNPNITQFKVIPLWDRYGTFQVGTARIAIDGNTKRKRIIACDNKLYTFREGGLRKWCQTDIIPGLLC